MKGIPFSNVSISFRSFFLFILSQKTWGCLSDFICGSLPVLFAVSPHHGILEFLFPNVFEVWLPMQFPGHLEHSPGSRYGSPKIFRFPSLLLRGKSWLRSHNSPVSLFGSCRRGSPPSSSCGLSHKTCGSCAGSWKRPARVDLLPVLFLWPELGWSMYFCWVARWYVIHTSTCLTLRFLCSFIIFQMLLTVSARQVCHFYRDISLELSGFVGESPSAIQMCWFIIQHCASGYAYLMPYVLFPVPFSIILWFTGCYHYSQHCIFQWFSEYHTLNTSISITQEVVRNTNSQAPS